ncbi:MAG: hypothetical protein ACYC3W_01565 [Candidatus Nanopelagicales bacterium]
MSKKILAIATVIAVAVLPVATASAASAAPMRSNALIGSYCC